MPQCLSCIRLKDRLLTSKSLLMVCPTVFLSLTLPPTGLFSIFWALLTPCTSLFHTFSSHSGVSQSGQDKVNQNIPTENKSKTKHALCKIKYQLPIINRQLENTRVVRPEAMNHEAVISPIPFTLRKLLSFHNVI